MPNLLDRLGFRAKDFEAVEEEAVELAASLLEPPFWFLLLLLLVLLVLLLLVFTFENDVEDWLFYECWLSEHLWREAEADSAAV